MSILVFRYFFVMIAGAGALRLQSVPDKNRALRKEANCLDDVNTPLMADDFLSSLDEMIAWKNVSQQYLTYHHNAEVDSIRKNKIALLFMIGDSFPHEQLWADWLREAPSDQFKVLVHSYEGNYLPKAKTFMNKTIPKIPGSWCHTELQILGLNAEALQDPSVSRTVLLCSSTIPLKPFNKVYAEIMRQESSQLCMDMEWGNRAMPWSYVWNRLDAGLFSHHQKELLALVHSAGSAQCPTEDAFVVPLKIAGRTFSPTCITWNGWNNEKGFHQMTNVEHYDNILEDPESLYTKSGCGHPITLHKISPAIMDKMMNDPSFLFARKFLPQTAIGAESVRDYLRSKIFPNEHVDSLA